MTSPLDSVPPDPEVDRVYREFPYVDRSAPKPIPASVLRALTLDRDADGWSDNDGTRVGLPEVAAYALALQGVVREFTSLSGSTSEWEPDSEDLDYIIDADLMQRARALLPADPEATK